MTTSGQLCPSQFKYSKFLAFTVDHVNSLSNSLRELRKDRANMIYIYSIVHYMQRIRQNRLCGNENRGRLH
jgi:hypothetical protein